MSHKKNELTFKYIYTYDYNPDYVNGAHGGISPRGELVVNFYLGTIGIVAPIGADQVHTRPNGTLFRDFGGDVVHPFRVIDEKHTIFGAHAFVDMRSFGGLEPC